MIIVAPAKSLKKDDAMTKQGPGHPWAGVRKHADGAGVVPVRASSCRVPGTLPQ